MENKYALTLDELMQIEFDNKESELDYKKYINVERILEAQTKLYKKIFNYENKDFEIYKQSLEETDDFYEKIYPLYSKEETKYLVKEITKPSKDLINTIKYNMYQNLTSKDGLDILSLSLISGHVNYRTEMLFDLAASCLYFRYFIEIPNIIKEINKIEDFEYKNKCKIQLNKLLENCFILLIGAEEYNKLFSEKINLYKEIQGNLIDESYDTGFLEWVEEKDKEEMESKDYLEFKEESKKEFDKIIKEKDIKYPNILFNFKPALKLSDVFSLPDYIVKDFIERDLI